MTDSLTYGLTDTDWLGKNEQDYGFQQRLLFFEKLQKESKWLKCVNKQI